MKTMQVKRYRFFVVLLLVTLRVTGQEQAQTPISLAPFADSRGHWYGIRDAGNLVNPVPNQPVYPASDIQHIADNILLYQRDNGGWPKNYDMQAILTSAQIDSLTRTKGMTHTTFDNGTTYSHVDYLAQVYCQTGIEKYKAGCLKGIAFILEAQYPNGGWPQYYPIEEGNYSRRITFNDGAFLGVMETLRKVADPSSCYAFVDESLRRRAAEAFRKGVDCILKAQIVSKGRLTVWCQQHDEKTLQPAWARAFEPPAICNGESAAIVRMLMSLDQPDERIIRAIQSAVKWFADSKILHTRIKTISTPPEQSQWKVFNTDRIVVEDPAAPPVWTRFYEPETERPLFCDRNSKYLYSLAEVSHERRSGYGWYTYAPQEVLDSYPAWQQKWVPKENVLAK